MSAATVWRIAASAAVASLADWVDLDGCLLLADDPFEGLELDEERRWRLRYFAGLFNVLDVRGYGSGVPVGREVPSTTVPRYGRSARVGLSIGF